MAYSGRGLLAEKLWLDFQELRENPVKEIIQVNEEYLSYI